MAAPTPNAPSSSSSGGLIPSEWSEQAATTVVDTVAKVRDKTTRPAQIASRAVVYGLMLAVAGVAAVVLLLILLVRAYSNWVPGDVWILYAVLSVLFLVAGVVVLGKANRPASTN